MMKTLMGLMAFLLMSACGGVEPPVDTSDSPISPTVQSEVPHQYCGDGICDETRGENEWWCVDCGYDPFIGGPANGGYCGDGVCFGSETMLSCFQDCRPAPYKAQSPWDPDYIDPPLFEELRNPNPMPSDPPPPFSGGPDDRIKQLRPEASPFPK